MAVPESAGNDRSADPPKEKRPQIAQIFTDRQQPSLGPDLCNLRNLWFPLPDKTRLQTGAVP